MLRYAAPLFVCLVLVGPHSYAQAPLEQPVTRQQAISRLGQLIDVHSVILTSTERQQVISACRQLQSTTLQSLSDKHEADLTKYTDAIESFRWGIDYSISNLRSMSEDSSNLDLASFHLTQIEDDLRSASRVYSRTLDEVLVIDCQVYPLEFMAGIEEVKDRRDLMRSSADELLEFFDEELLGAYQKVDGRLQKIEGLAQ